MFKTSNHSSSWLKEANEKLQREFRWARILWLIMALFFSVGGVYGILKYIQVNGTDFSIILGVLFPVALSIIGVYGLLNVSSYFTFRNTRPLQTDVQWVQKFLTKRYGYNEIVRLEGHDFKLVRKLPFTSVGFSYETIVRFHDGQAYVFSRLLARNANEPMIFFDLFGTGKRRTRKIIVFLEEYFWDDEAYNKEAP